MDLVAALEAQHLAHIRENCPLGEEGSMGGSTGSVDNSGATSSPKESRRSEKKRWKNWSWKYSPGGKTTSIEEEPESPKKTSRHSSPTSSPKHKKHDLSGNNANNNNNNNTNSSNNSNGGSVSMSPLRRKNRNANATAANAGMPGAAGPTSAVIGGRMVEVRSSAGARLCQMLDDSQDESGDEFQALLANGRPASVHIVQMTSGVSLLNNDIFE